MAKMPRLRRLRTRAPMPALVIEPAGDYRAHTATVPKECSILGTVSVGGATGALVRLWRTRVYVRVTDGQIHMLNQARVEQRLLAMQRDIDSPVEMIPV